MLDFMMAAQLLPTGSLVHRLDPRTRLVGFCALFLPLVATSRVTTALLALSAILGLVAVARVPLGYSLRGLRLALPWLLVVALMQLLIGPANGPDCAPLWEASPLSITTCSLQLAAVTLTRFAGLLLLMALLTWTTPIPSLVQGLEALAAPFGRVGLPVHGFVLVGVIALRFLPTMALEFERLQKAQVARGANLGRGRTGFIRRVRRTLPLVVPIFVLALERAERLAEAMEARAYAGGRRRSMRRSRRLSIGRSDWMSLVLLALFVIVIRVIN
jgi:energy-coupling factor transport system permease protein